LKGKKPAEIIGKTVDDQKEPITVVVDSSGLTTTNRGSYIEDKWRKEKRKFVKLHILADRKTGKIAGFRVTSEHTGGFKEICSTRQGGIKEKQDHKSVWRHCIRCKEELQPLRRTGDRACNQDQKERKNAVQEALLYEERKLF
jgi:hypothetical protein